MRRLRVGLGEVLGGIVALAVAFGLSVPLVRASSTSIGDATRSRIMAVIWASVAAFALTVQVVYWWGLVPLLRRGRRDRDRLPRNRARERTT